MGKRRNPFADWMDDNAGQDGPEQGLPLPGQPEPPPAAPPPPRSVLDQLGLPEPEKKGRGRAWEKRNKPHVYRNVPRTLRKQTQDIAQKLEVRADDVFRAFFEFGLSEIEADKLTLIAAPEARHMTLYPDGWQSRSAWGQKPKNTPNRSLKQKSKKHLEGILLSIRALPDTLHTQLITLAQQLHIPVGELVTALLEHAITTYKNNDLHLYPTEEE